MKNKLLATLTTACALIPVFAEGASSAEHNLKTTRAHYAKLINSTPQKLAELTLFTTMMPKGGDLHHHYTGAIYVETYLDWVDAQNLCIYTKTIPGTKAQKYRVGDSKQSPDPQDTSLCISGTAVRQNNSFYRELLSLWSDKDFGNHYHEQLAPDQQFFNTFGYFGPASAYDYNKGLQSLKQRAISENLGYLETMLRGAPSVAEGTELSAKLEQAFASLNEQSTPQEITSVLKQAFDWLENDPKTASNIASYVNAATAAAANLDDEQFTVRFQAYVSRNSSPAAVFSGLYASFLAATQSPLIVGINIVGPENGYVAMKDYHLHMEMIGFLKKTYPNTKLALHAGELTLGMVPPEGLRFHIQEAVNLAGANRIGHGVDIPYESNTPQLLRTMKSKDVAVEINLTSNAFILGVQNDAHPLPLYIKAGVPFVISTDDAGVSRNNLSGEYMLFASRYKPTYDQIKAASYRSIRYSFLPPAEKKRETLRLDKRFAKFEAEITQLGR